MALFQPIQIQVKITLPRMLDPNTDGRSGLNRKHNQMIREAAKSTLWMHHREHMPLHFQSGNAGRYKHAKRMPKTIAKKVRLYSAPPDLVKTGRLKRLITKQRPRMMLKGAASAGRQTAEAVYRMPS